MDVFFFKQKTAYEIGVRLVGSEMCIRDRPNTGALIPSNWLHKGQPPNTLIGNEIRTTIAFSFCDPEIHDKIIEQNTRKWY